MLSYVQIICANIINIWLYTTLKAACFCYHASLHTRIYMKKRHHQAITLEQAANESPVLGSLMQQALRAKDMQAKLQPLVPEGIRPALAYGKVDEHGQWSIFVHSSAAAAKVRQLLPKWVAYLQQQGCAIQGILLRVDAQQQTKVD